MPERRRGEVDRELATMDSQITEAYKRFADQKEQIEAIRSLRKNAILDPLKDKRLASIDRIVARHRPVRPAPAGHGRPRGLCRLRR